MAMTAEALSVNTDGTPLVKTGTPTTTSAALTTATETPYVYGYHAAANILREFGAPYSTPESLKSICSKVRKVQRIVPYFPEPVVNGKTVIFDRRRLAAWAKWKNGGENPTAIYRTIDVAESRRRIELQKLELQAERDLKEVLTVLAASEHGAMNRLTNPQMRTLVNRFKDLLWDYDWSFEDNGPRRSW
jgi:hypothetical protein